LRATGADINQTKASPLVISLVTNRSMPKAKETKKTIAEMPMITPAKVKIVLQAVQFQVAKSEFQNEFFIHD